MPMALTKDLPSDNVYAYALAKTLTKVCSPATVGLYSSCQNRINMILRHIEVHMEQEAERREKANKLSPMPRSPTPSLCSLLALISRLLFFRPVWTEENQEHQNVRFIFVRFSAWHFAGSDLLWAGLAIRLCQSLQESFGKLQLALYRVAQHDEEDELKKKVVEEDGRNQWRSKKLCCCPLWFLVLTILLAAATILALLLKFGFPKPAEVEGGGELGVAGEGQGARTSGVIEGLAIASLGVPAVGAARFIFRMGKNLVFNQDLNIRRSMDNERVSSKLGFMNEVRKEMWLLSSFIHFMEVFERRRIRVVLEITNLDRCEPKKIVGVLDAINILLSEEGSPFISLLAVNPEVLVQQVDFADGWFSKEDRAYAFLNRIVTLAFTIPPLCTASKRKVFSNIVIGQSEITEDLAAKASGQRRLCCTKVFTSSKDSLVMRAEPNDIDFPLINKNYMKENRVAFGLIEEEVEKLVQLSFKTIIASNSGNLHKYISDDTMSMRRVINAIRVTVVIMETLKEELPSPEHIAAWVVLANEWPCRLSWILQCLEDDQQRAQIDDESAAVNASKTLWEVFAESRAELHLMRNEIDELLEQDGDPEMFEMFLKVDYRFAVSDTERFKLSTVNLDHSIRMELARIRGTARLRDCGWRRGNLPTLSVRTVINMSTEDICKELEKLELPDMYMDVVRSNKLNGQTLVFGDTSDLKHLFQMTLSEWTTFCLHFLSTGRRCHPLSTPAPLSHQQLKHRLSRHRLSPQRGSTLSLVASS